MNFESCKIVPYLNAECASIEEVKCVAEAINMLSDRIKFLTNEVEQIRLKLNNNIQNN